MHGPHPTGTASASCIQVINVFHAGETQPSNRGFFDVKRELWVTLCPLYISANSDLFINTLGDHTNDKKQLRICYVMSGSHYNRIPYRRDPT